MAPERAADATFHDRFERETRLAAAIDHPNVIPVYEAGEQEGRLYLVMRWVQGGDLHKLIADSGPLDPELAAAIVAQVGSGLEAAHAAGLVHRDVKPANVLIAGEEGSGPCHLSDFGLTLDASAESRLTQTGDLIGTVDFMAPEQFEGHPVSARTDIYALGCVLHTALSGRPPFPRGTFAATMLAHLGDPAPRPSATPGVPASFDGVVARALAKRPDDRYPSASELVAAALAAAGTSAGPRAVPPARGPAEQNGSASAATVALPATTLPLEDGPQRARAERSAPMCRPPGSAGHLHAGEPPRPSLLGRPGPGRRSHAGRGARRGRGSASDRTMRPVRSARMRCGSPRTRSPPPMRARMATPSRDVLTRDVARVTPGDTQRGRDAVVREYRGQFATNSTRTTSSRAGRERRRGGPGERSLRRIPLGGGRRSPGESSSACDASVVTRGSR